jgi:hypothetical protein
MKRYITLPNGNACSLPTYVKAWRTLKAARPEAQIEGWDHFATEAGEILRDMTFGVHDRINRHIPGYGRGRKWSSDWQRAMIQASDRLNTPRLIIDWLPTDLKKRFAHRLRVNLVDF